MSGSREGLGASIHARLVKLAKAKGVDAQQLFTRFAIERFLYRLSQSNHADRFVLKGGTLMPVWLGEELRPTRDADLLGLGDLSGEALLKILREVCRVECPEDGMNFDPESIEVGTIREEDPYSGRRAHIAAHFGNARIRVQVDVGIGDDVYSEPEQLEYPVLLDLPAPSLRAYRPETSIAEKFHIVTVLGMANSRMKDYFDISELAKRESFDREVLSTAIARTFQRRKTPLPKELPLGLTSEFHQDSEKQTQWQAFQRKNKLDPEKRQLPQVVEIIAGFLGPLLSSIDSVDDDLLVWPPGGPWQ